MASLLPANATPLEMAMVAATDPTGLTTAADGIAGIKSNPPDALLPFLLWEYGLGELLPYLSDPRSAIAEGVLWQRTRGTPAALITALGWVGLNPAVEQEVPGVHFAEFLIDAGAVPDSARLNALLGIAKLSAPARSRLARVFNQGWDLRRVMLDDSRLGDALLSDYSGVMHTDGITKLSFARLRQLALPEHHTQLATGKQSERVSFTRLIDKVILDFSRLGVDKDTPNHKIIHSHLFTKANLDALRNPHGLLPQRQFCKAMIALGDSWTLGDTNACTPRRRLTETGKQLVLSNGDKLSEIDQRLFYDEVLERFDVSHPAAPLPPLVIATRLNRQAWHSLRIQHQAELRLGEMLLGNDKPTRDHHARVSEHHRNNAPIRESVSLEQPRFFVKAQLVLGDSWTLGDINSRTIKTGWYRSKPVPTLGDFALGDAAEIEQRVIVECLTQTAQLTTPIPFNTGTALTSKAMIASHCVNARFDVTTAASQDATNSLTATYAGQTWTGVKWADASWAAMREVVGVGHISA